MAGYGMLRAVDYKDSAPMYGYGGQWYITIMAQAEKSSGLDCGA